MLDGIIGDLWTVGRVQACINEGAITAIGIPVGQICGYVRDRNMIVDCEERGTISEVN